MPPSRENWELLVFIFQLFPLVCLLPPSAVCSKLNPICRLPWPSSLQTGGLKARLRSSLASIYQERSDGR